jgi:hypothetical protein
MTYSLRRTSPPSVRASAPAWIVLLAAFFVLPSPAAAQDPSLHAAFTGRVVTATGEAPAEPVDVSLRTYRMLPFLGEETEVRRRRGEQARRSGGWQDTSTDADGRFDFEGVPPGSYWLMAGSEKEGLALHGPFDIAPRATGDLGEPVVLYPAVHPTVRIIPAQTPDGEPWKLRVHTTAELGRGLQVAETETDAEGRWIPPVLLPAREYRVELATAWDTVYADRTVELADGEKTLALPLTEVAGTVTLGGEPLPATTLRFHDGLVTVSFEADADGRYRGTLPRPGNWDLLLTADAPPVFVQESGLSVASTRDSADGEPARLDVALPDHRIAGRVVDETGEPVEGASISMQRAGMNWTKGHFRSDADGRFTAHGVETVEVYYFRADWRPDDDFYGTSGTSDTEIGTLDSRGRQRPDDLTLTIVRQRGLAGRLLADGEPVVAAQIDYTGDHENLVVSPTSTDAEGRFRLRIPVGMDRVTVTAGRAGEVLTRRTLTVPDEGELALELHDGPGGTLVVHHRDGDDRLMVQHGGERPFFLFQLGSWGEKNLVPQTDETTTVPHLPPGDYRLCRRGTEDCADGTLEAGGELVLSLDG